MSELQSAPDIALQYPLACRIRQRLFQNHSAALSQTLIDSTLIDSTLIDSTLIDSTP